MELEFPGFVLLLMVAIGLVAFGPRPQFAGERVGRMAAAPIAAPCAGVTPDEASHFFGAPAPPVACTVY